MPLTFRVPKEITFVKAKPSERVSGKKKKKKELKESSSSSSEPKRSRNNVVTNKKVFDNYQSESSEHFETSFNEQVKLFID